MVPVVLQRFGAEVAFLVAALFFGLGGLIVLVLGPEARNKVLEDVSG